MRLEKELFDLAARQQGCIAHWQVAALGGTRTELARLHCSGRWTTPLPGVLSPAGTVRGDALLASAAVLAAGSEACLSHGSAAAWWGVPGYRLLPAHVAHLDELGVRRAHPGALHRPRALPTSWRTEVGGIAVVRPELMCYQLCGLVHPLKAERAFDAAWNLRLLSVSSAQACLTDLAKRGRNGTRVYRSILRARSDKDLPPGSNLESRVQQLLRRAGISMRRQVDVGGDHWDGRVDFVGDTDPLVLEVQSERHHSALTDELRDAQRHANHHASGFEVVTVWDNDVWTNPDRVIDQVRAGLVRARERRARPQ